MLNYANFLEKNKSLLVAPAGYGKTHTIIECLKILTEKQLILTHTHAGVNSILDKCKKNNINPDKYYIDTITSYVRKYVIAFCNNNQLLKEDDKNYYNDIMKHAYNLFTKPAILDIISATFSGVFVDEYQDCTESQHLVIMKISHRLPMRLLGDYLQGIFAFNKNTAMVDLTNQDSMPEFHLNRFNLETPYRWGERYGIRELLKTTRSLLESDQVIDLRKLKNELITYHKVADIYSKENKKIIATVISKYKDVLILIPESGSINPRIKFVQQFSYTGELIIMESFDSKDFYEAAKLIDECIENSSDYISLAYDILEKYHIVNITVLKKWIKNGKFIKKRNLNDQARIKEMEKDVQLSFINCLNTILRIPEIKIYRVQLLSLIRRSLETYKIRSVSVCEIMSSIIQIDKIRGRCITGKILSTTLLTKGLEFENVVVINAHEFTCHKHFYVALTRFSKKLTIFSKEDIISFKKTDDNKNNYIQPSLFD